MPEITMLYAGLMAVLFAMLSTAAAMKRGATNTPYGDGGGPELGLALRRFGNLAEYAAMALVIMLLLELSGAAPVWLHTYGAALIAFRVLHPFVIFADPDASLALKIGRFIAAAGTAGLLAIGGVALLISAI
ncbi:MAG: MAPEG family protein [Pseudomonadota bacterium]